MMQKIIIGKKLGMTRMFHQGTSVPVTVICATPNTIIKVYKSDNNSGNVQIGAGSINPKKINKPMAGHLKSSGATPQIINEFKIDDTKDFKIGEKISVEQFSAGEKVKITSVTKGKGFAGVIKRHGFHRGPETHGSDHHRSTGSIGGGYPQRVVKGRKMPGQLGNKVCTLKNIEIVDVVKEDNLLLLKGSIPGAKGWVKIQL